MATPEKSQPLIPSDPILIHDPRSEEEKIEDIGKEITKPEEEPSPPPTKKVGEQEPTRIDRDDNSSSGGGGSSSRSRRKKPKPKPKPEPEPKPKPKPEVSQKGVVEKFNYGQTLSQQEREYGLRTGKIKPQTAEEREIVRQAEVRQKVRQTSPELYRLTGGDTEKYILEQPSGEQQTISKKQAKEISKEVKSKQSQQKERIETIRQFEPTTATAGDILKTYKATGQTDFLGLSELALTTQQIQKQKKQKKTKKQAGDLFYQPVTERKVKREFEKLKKEEQVSIFNPLENLEALSKLTETTIKRTPKILKQTAKLYEAQKTGDYSLIQGLKPIQELPEITEKRALLGASQIAGLGAIGVSAGLGFLPASAFILTAASTGIGITREAAQRAGVDESMISEQYIEPALSFAVETGEEFLKSFKVRFEGDQGYKEYSTKDTIQKIQESESIPAQIATSFYSQAKKSVTETPVSSALYAGQIITGWTGASQIAGGILGSTGVGAAVVDYGEDIIDTATDVVPQLKYIPTAKGKAALIGSTFAIEKATEYGLGRVLDMGVQTRLKVGGPATDIKVSQDVDTYIETRGLEPYDAELRKTWFSTIAGKQKIEAAPITLSYKTTKGGEVELELKDGGDYIETRKLGEVKEVIEVKEGKGKIKRFKEGKKTFETEFQPKAQKQTQLDIIEESKIEAESQNQFKLEGKQYATITDTEIKELGLSGEIQPDVFVDSSIEQIQRFSKTIGIKPVETKTAETEFYFQDSKLKTKRKVSDTKYTEYDIQFGKGVIDQQVKPDLLVESELVGPRTRIEEYTKIFPKETTLIFQSEIKGEVPIYEKQRLSMWQSKKGRLIQEPKKTKELLISKPNKKSLDMFEEYNIVQDYRLLSPQVRMQSYITPTKKQPKEIQNILNKSKTQEINLEPAKAKDIDLKTDTTQYSAKDTTLDTDTTTTTVQDIDIQPEFQQEFGLDIQNQIPSKIETQTDTRLSFEQQQKTRFNFLNFSLPSLFKTKGKPKQTGFQVFAKVKGSWESLGKSAMTEQEAFLKGAEFVETTPAASFKVQETREKVTSSDRRKANIFKDIFRKSKKEEDVFVEKRKYRISTKGEKIGITEKGLATLKFNTKQNSRWF